MSEKTLQEQLEEVEAELRNEHQRGALMDSGKVEDLAVRRQELNAQISAQVQAEREQAIEQKVHNEAVSFAIEGVDFQELPAALITIIEKVVKADRRRIYAEHAAELEKVENERDDLVAGHQAMAFDFDQLQEEYNACARELKEQTEETVRLIAERDDARKNRDNAARQLEEAKAEIARLESQVDDYQKAKVLGERQAQAVIDVTPNEAEEINAAIKTFLKSEDWGSIIKVVKPDESFELVKRDVFEKEWTAITPPPMLGGSDNGAATFQGEDTQANPSDSGIPSAETPVIDFRPQAESNTVGLEVVGDEVVRSDDAPATWGELKALEARIDERLQRIELQAVAVA